MNDYQLDKSPFSGLAAALLGLTVFYICFSAASALLLKFIFLDYFVRVGYDVFDVSYLTVMMFLLFLKTLTSFASFSFRKSIRQ